MLLTVSGLPERMARTWCRLTHPAPMWPVNGHYRCPECLRSFEVPWADPKRNPTVVKQSQARRAPGGAMPPLASQPGRLG